ncbi:hypothetical protein ETD86_40860 [Nonomuraea turkmeniaca]|uniref:Uncharacterized protein n=1 Tax=Nonomuraea turkmeniaca TaxID=103838 RepID=A0A5S4F2H2_9ACTN|nr:hypothetical protein [Nonomuraea turkmeniaca]TMR10078.1 hypothetical protein ETD86_40860 [Nonomuraea turkmeniaca]
MKAGGAIPAETPRERDAMSDTITVTHAYLRDAVGEKRSQMYGMMLLAQTAAAIRDDRADYDEAVQQLATDCGGAISPSEAFALIGWVLSMPYQGDGFHNWPTITLLTRLCNVPAPAPAPATVTADA